MSLPASHLHNAGQRLVELTQELLDAHCDTLCLADAPALCEEEWTAHRKYLQDLQRAGQRVLAELAEA